VTSIFFSRPLGARVRTRRAAFACSLAIALVAFLGAPGSQAYADTPCKTVDNIAGKGGRVVNRDAFLDELSTGQRSVQALSTMFEDGAGSQKNGFTRSPQAFISIVWRVHVLTQDAGSSDKTISGPAIAALDALNRIAMDPSTSGTVEVQRLKNARRDVENAKGAISSEAFQEELEAIVYFAADADEYVSAVKKGQTAPSDYWRKDDVGRATLMYVAIRAEMANWDVQKNAYDANGDLASRNNPDEWLLEQWADGAPTYVRCPNDPVGTVYDPKNSQRKWYNNFTVTGERDTLALSTYNLADPFAGSPSVSAQSTKNPTTGNTTYAPNVQAVIGYQWPRNTCELEQKTACWPWFWTSFVDVYYGRETNPVGGAEVLIDRLGVGGSFAGRISFTNDFETVLQVIPEFITDTGLGSKIAYGEIRLDLLELRVVPPFNCFGADYFPLHLWDLSAQLSCGAAVIVDGEHRFTAAPQNGLFEEFARAGGEVGLKIRPDREECTGGLVCTYVLNHLSASAWYRILPDISGNGASIHNFSATLAYSASDDGRLAFFVTYMDGLDDITLFRQPNLKYGLRASL
jgi:hypothetical protein